jgi:hypothetical protein
MIYYMTWIFYGRKVLHVCGFMHQNFPYDLITWNLLPQRKNMNHEKHVTPEEISMSINLNICNFLLHGKTTIMKIERQFCFFKYFLLCDCIIDWFYA